MRVLVAGIGNIFLSDDGFGCEVARALATVTIPPEVEVVDYGIRGVHLAYQLLDGYDALVLVDALRQGEEPGTISVMEPDRPGQSRAQSPSAGTSPPMAIDAHGMDPESVLRSLSGLGGSVERILIVGCEPLSVDEGIGLSEVVQEAVMPAVGVVLDVVAEILANGPGDTHEGDGAMSGTTMTKTIGS